MCNGTGTSYIQELTDAQLLEFITDMQNSPQKTKDAFDYDLHVAELINRSSCGKMLNRADIIRGLNNVDKSFDHDSEKVYVIDVEEFLTALGF